MKLQNYLINKIHTPVYDSNEKLLIIFVLKSKNEAFCSIHVTVNLAGRNDDGHRMILHHIPI